MANLRARQKMLNDAHFDRFLKFFRSALDEMGGAPVTAEKVMKLLESKRAKVLNR